MTCAALAAIAIACLGLFAYAQLVCLGCRITPALRTPADAKWPVIALAALIGFILSVCGSIAASLP